MSTPTAFRKIIRAAYYNPHSLPKRMAEMELALNRELETTDVLDLVTMLDVVEEETARYLRQTEAREQNSEGPTRQTVRKLREDPVVLLKSRGTISKDDEVTIQEIREIRFKLAMGLSSGGGEIGDRVDTSRKTFVHPIERLTKRQADIYDRVYKPWAKKSSKTGIRTGKKRRELGITPFGLVIAVIEDGVPLARLEKYHRVKHGVLSGPLKLTIQDFGDRLGKSVSEGCVERRKEG